MLVATHIHPLPTLHKLTRVYHAARRSAGHAAAVPDDITLLMPVFVAKDAAAARNALEPSVLHSARLSAALAEAALPTCDEAQRRALEPLLNHLRTLAYDRVESTMGAVGTPAQCVARLSEVQREFDPGRIITWFNFGGLIPHAEVVASMALFSRDVAVHWRREVSLAA